MSEYNTALIKYIYLDVVGFTHNRPVEAQTDIISALNKIVRQSVSSKISEEQVIYIPVGDGICTSIIGNTTNYDDHILIAQDIIRQIVSIHNPSAVGNRQFEVRIGINENIDNIIADIKGDRNCCGAGINFAQRVMSYADASQILVGITTYENLRYREKYSRAFRKYTTVAKHDTTLNLYQYIGGNVAGINREIPSVFSPSPERQLTKYVAYYIAHILDKQSFIEHTMTESYRLYALGLQMAYLAEDSVGHSSDTKFRTYDNHMPDTPNNTLQEQFDLLFSLPWHVCLDLFESKVRDKVESPYRDCFEYDSDGLIASEKGKNKLKSEWSNICEEFGLS